MVLDFAVLGPWQPEAHWTKTEIKVRSTCAAYFPISSSSRNLKMIALVWKYDYTAEWKVFMSFAIIIICLDV